MSGVSLDTSGAVGVTEDNRLSSPSIAEAKCIVWSDLSAFEQGYVEAMLSGVTKPFELAKVYRTSDGQAVCIMQRNDVPGYECVKGDDPADDHPEGGWRYNRASDRGRVTGSAFDMSDPRNLIPENAAFSDLAPETLAAIRKDCAEASRDHLIVGNGRYEPEVMREIGRQFWFDRHRGFLGGEIPQFKPQTPILSEDGKVRFQ